MSMSLRRKMALREQAKKERGVATRLAGLSRAGQVARSTVPVGESDLPVVETLETVVDTAEVLPGVIESADQAGSDAYDAAMNVGAALAEALQAAQDAADALTAANGKNSRRRGVTEPEPPEGGWVQGDQWVRDEDRAGVMTPVQVLVWNGTEFVPEQIIADDILVIGEDGAVRLADGSVSAVSMAADFYVGREFFGTRFEGGRFDLATLGSRTELYSNPGTSTTGWRGFGESSVVTLDTGRYRTPPSSLKAATANNGLSNAQNNTLGKYVPPGTTATVSVWVYSSGSTITVQIGPDISTDYGSFTAQVPINTWHHVLVETVVSDAPLNRLSITSSGSNMWIDDVAIYADAGTQTGVNIFRDLAGIALVDNTGPAGAFARLSGGALSTNQPVNRFSLKSQLDAFQAADGTHAWVTSEGREYVRAGGLWQGLSDVNRNTGWIAFAMEGWTVQDNAPAQARIRNGNVEFMGTLSSSDFAGGFTTVGQLPAGIPAPPGSYVVGDVGMNSPATTRIRITVTGVVQMYRETVSGTWINLKSAWYALE